MLRRVAKPALAARGVELGKERRTTMTRYSAAISRT